MSDTVNLASLSDALAGTPFAGKIEHLQSVPSTNQLALEAAQAGAPHGSVWIADEQTAGRGRGGHQWLSVPGDGLYVSILLRPKMSVAEALWLSLAAGLAAHTAISRVTGLRPDIRWPNDLLLNRKKCGGILVETSAAASRPDTVATLRFAVIGIGINVNHEAFPHELQSLATSLRQETGKLSSRQEVLTALLQALHLQISSLETELNASPTDAPLLMRFAAASTWVSGKRVSVDESGGYTGLTSGLDSRGFLLVAGDDGLLHTVLSGGVREAAPAT